MNCKLFGWAKNKKGETVCVSEVPKGIACDCLCPNCNAPLLARKGKVRTHHFAHAKGMECQHGYEASVHLLAKEVFHETKTLCLPRFALRRDYTTGNERILIHNSRRSKNRDCEIHDPELIELMRDFATDTPYYADKQKPPVKFDEILVEQFRGDVKPDAVAIKNGHELFVEFMFSHAVDNDKYEKLVESESACVEIDLSNVNLKNDRDSDFNTMEKHLTDESNIRWIFYPEAIEKIRKNLKNIKLENHKKTSPKNYSTPDAVTQKRQNKEQVKHQRTPYSKMDSDNMYGDNCSDILNRVKTGGDEVCAYIKELREIMQRGEYLYLWQDMIGGKREQCRRCPDHKIDCYNKVFCSRYGTIIVG